MTDEQLIENLRARTWPGDCEAAAFRIEELLARVAELEAQNIGLLDIATGKVEHAWSGACPDSDLGHGQRDPDCLACRIIQSAEAGGQL